MTHSRIAQEVHAALLRKNKTVSVAESCTGGLISKILTDLPHSSRFFFAGIIVYDNRAKVSFLGIPWRSITRNGAVSGETALAMAINTRKLTHTDYAIAATGIAGPGGGSKNKPVGTVWISIATKTNAVAKKYSLKGTRADIRLKAAYASLNLLNSLL